MQKFSDGDLLRLFEAAIDYDYSELGLRPAYSFGTNDYSGMTISEKPMMPLYYQ